MSGIGVIIIITQLFPVLGYDPGKDPNMTLKNIPKAQEQQLEKILQNEAGEGVKVIENYENTLIEAGKISKDEIVAEAQNISKKETGSAIGAVKFLPTAIKNINPLHFGMVLLTIVIIYGFKRVTTKVPSTLVALLLVSLLVYLFKLNIDLIDKIPQGFPEFHLASVFSNTDLSVFSHHITDIFSLAILGSIDSLLTSVVADNMTKSKHDSNQELIGQGVGNTMAALFGGLPGAGATIRTVVNINSGGRTKLSGMIAGLLLLVVLLALGPLASMIPKAVLAGILITVGIGVMDYKGLKSIRKIPKPDAFVMILVLVLTVFLGLIEAVALGMIISALVFMKKMGDISTKESNFQSMAELKSDMIDELQIPDKLKEEIFIKKISGPLFFGVTDEVKELTNRIPSTAKIILMDMRAVPYMDQSGVFAMEDILIENANKDIKTLLFGLKEQPQYLLERIDAIPNLIPHEFIFNDFARIGAWLEDNVKDEI